MLFDHGCDAINAGVFILPFASAIGIGRDATIFFCFFNAFVPFYTQTWEEYYREEMVLPVINGPSEGLTIVVGICITSYLKGSIWWQTVYFIHIYIYIHRYGNMHL
jgi:ethanolaminephosphotransferase